MKAFPNWANETFLIFNINKDTSVEVPEPMYVSHHLMIIYILV